VAEKIICGPADSPKSPPGEQDSKGSKGPPEHKPVSMNCEIIEEEVRAGFPCSMRSPVNEGLLRSGPVQQGGRGDQVLSTEVEEVKY
jgi:hypothetical protein